ncbi:MULTISPECIES: hypothetical protein [Rhizobium]|jgi:hypothetical protein|uniref:hypothetical protein n=1 Tax=Rhizobium TaxID=379 RepID=UPI0010311F8E|nr:MULTISPECIES: hypothetical protein [Rhizobium]NKL63322.1 hypothetical protein [Rhizobium leguminosarum bv. viciae]TBA24751.1 hypothetical protein ELH61_02565 [Rhizobium ruizarguesonis]
MRDVLFRHRVFLLVVTTAVVLTAFHGLLAGLTLIAVVLAVHEHHVRLRYRASFRNARRMLALESQRCDAIESYLDGILAAARGDADGVPERILH